jgi:chemotaxis methyl-accepting protein methylase
MAEVHVGDYTDYRDLLETNADEFTNLFNTILINVTSFFRDTEAWQYLQREVLPTLLADADPRTRSGCGARGAPAAKRHTPWRSCSRRR